MNCMTRRYPGADVARLAVLLTLLSGALPAQAIDVFFTGTLVAPPACVVNGNADVSVDFGNNVLIGQIDGVNYEQPITYSLDCSAGAGITTAMKMQLQGNGAVFEGTVLGTSKTDLGLEMRTAGAKWPLNTWRNFVYPAQPVLTAVPVKATASTLAGGAFTASATLLVDYQ